MGLTSNQRNYNLTDADLMMFASNLVQTITRDAVQFADFGVDAAAIAAFEALGNQFETFPPDTFYLADISIATESKDNARKNLLLEIRKITNRAMAKWGENSPQYRKFGVKGLTDMNDKELLATSRLVVTTATQYIPDLTADGLNQAAVDDYAAVAQLFEDSMNNLNSAVEIRDKKTQERIALGNQLYALVTKYCSFGKSIWDKVDDAYFNDYIIYTETTPGTLLPPQNLVFNYSAKTLWWDVVDNATSYQLQWWNGTDFEELYAGSDINFGFTPPDGLNKFRVRAHNAGGYGPWSDELNQYYFAVLPKAANLQVVQSGTIPTEGELTWNAVPTAASYKVYQSIDNLGEYPAHWLVIATVTEPLKSVTLTLGKRNSFRVETNNTYQTSMSDPIFIEVS